MAASRALAGGAPPKAAGPCRIMIVEDSAVVRGMVTRIVEAEPDMAVVHSVVHGADALKAARRAPVDIVLLDVEMPVMDGLTALPKLVEALPGARIIMNSTLTRRNASVTIQALAMGAADFVTKPSTHGELGSASAFATALLAKIRALAPGAGKAALAPGKPPQADSGGLYRGAAIEFTRGALFRPGILAVGASTGGPQALCRLFKDLGRAPGLPVVVAQHMPPTFTAILAEHVAKVSGIAAGEAVDGEPLRAGRIYVAPGDFHMTLAPAPAGAVIRLDQKPPENFCRPAVDPLLRSVAGLYAGRALVVILTGMGHDGLAGARAVVERGGVVLAQDEASSVVWGMPGAVATNGLCRAVLPLAEIGPRLARLFREHTL